MAISLFSFIVWCCSHPIIRLSVVSVHKICRAIPLNANIFHKKNKNLSILCATFVSFIPYFLHIFYFFPSYLHMNEWVNVVYGSHWFCWVICIMFHAHYLTYFIRNAPFCNGHGMELWIFILSIIRTEEGFGGWVRTLLTLPHAEAEAYRRAIAVECTNWMITDFGRCTIRLYLVLLLWFVRIVILRYVQCTHATLWFNDLLTILRSPAITLTHT